MRAFVLALVILSLPFISVFAQEKEILRLPKTDWSMDHGVALAIAAAKGNEVRIRLSVPMWAPKPGLNRDPQGEEDFNVSQMRGVLEAADVKVYRKNGTVVEPTEWPRLLAKETHVLWSGRKLDPYYLTVMRDDVLVVVVDFGKIIQASGGEGAPPMPVPAPAPAPAKKDKGA
jgi:hypothetical protein